jgi:hypothetical protein
LRDRGQLARFDEISQDRQSWTAAGRMPRMFRQLDEAPRTRAPSFSKSAPSTDAAEFIVLGEDDDTSRSPARVSTTAEDDSEWYYARDRTQHGPVRLSRLQQMTDSGEIGPSTLVWTSRFDQWIPASQVDEIRFPVRFDTIAAAQDGSRKAESSSMTLPPRQTGESFDPANPPHRTSILAINSLVIGCLWLLGLGSLAAIALGVSAMHQIAHSQGTLTGKRIAIAGILVGLAGLALTLGLLILPRLLPGSSP